MHLIWIKSRKGFINNDSTKVISTNKFIPIVIGIIALVSSSCFKYHFDKILFHTLIHVRCLREIQPTLSTVQGLNFCLIILNYTNIIVTHRMSNLYLRYYIQDIKIPEQIHYLRIIYLLHQVVHLDMEDILNRATIT